jgi:hypothetical protein
MSLWEFRLRSGNETVGQTVISEGDTEADAAAASATLISGKPDVTLSRPGEKAAPDVEARWREVVGGVLPTVVSDTGRFARYARGLPPTER